MPARINPALAVAIASLILAVPSARALGPVNVTLLTGLNGDFDANYGFSINNHRTVGGMSSVGLQQGFIYDIASLWSNGSFTTLPRSAGVPTTVPGQSAVFALNSANIAVGTTSFQIPGFNVGNHAAKWVNGTITDLGQLPGYEYNRARAINDSATIVGSSFTIVDFTSAAFRATGSGTLQSLALLPTHNSSSANAINNAGLAVGYSGFQDLDFTTAQNPVVWDTTLDNPAPIAVPIPAGYTLATASSINDVGTIVGSTLKFDESTYEYADVRPYISINGVSTLLPLPDGAISGTAQSINNLGWILGTASPEDLQGFYGYGSFGGGTPILWTDTEIVDLNALLQPAFPAGSTFNVSSLNDLGDLVGTVNYTTPLGVRTTQPFIASIPEPTTPAVLLPTLPLLLRRNRRRA